MIPGGRTGPNDERRQSDLNLGFDVEQKNRLRVPLIVVLSEQEAQKAIQSALKNGFQRDNPNWPNWSDREKKNAVQYWLLGLIHEDLMK